MQSVRSCKADSAVQQVFCKMASEIFVSSDLFDEVFVDEQPAGKRQEDSRFPERAETDLNEEPWKTYPLESWMLYFLNSTQK